MLSRVVHLKLSRPRAKGYIRANEWRHLLRQFSAVRTLRVCRGFAEHVALASEDVTAEMVAEVFPVLDLVYLGGQPVSSVEKFLAARRLSGRPVTIVDLEVVFDERVKSYDTSTSACVLQLEPQSSPMSAISSHRDRSLSPPSFTEPLIEPVPSIGNPSSDFSLPNDSSSGLTSHGPYKGPEVKNVTRILREKRGEVQAQGKSHGRAITINVLPDNVLLDIFDTCRKDHDPSRSHHPILFGSPRRLDLHILCTNGTRVRENLNIWPPFPIAIQYPSYKTLTPDDEDSLFAALEHLGRIRHIDLGLTGPQLREVATMMQVSFPILTHLALGWKDERPPPLPSGFLGGSIPRLQHMHLNGVLFPALPVLLSSISDLTFLSLDDIPHEGYIAPEEMAAYSGLERAGNGLRSTLIEYIHFQ
ncbi:hypothetical protein EDB85DRAFT_2157948 [Lactarius pseudohatsudake]|nr:hypothetical protein EDB85DRAFT_2157948 [Lactarius pseudohatsudake]